MSPTSYQTALSRDILKVDGVKGFEPLMTGPKPVALPLGYTPPSNRGEIIVIFFLFVKSYEIKVSQLFKIELLYCILLHKIQSRKIELKKATKKEIIFIKEAFLKHYKNAKTELRYTNLYELIVSVMLSAQCTDKRVNIITPKLFEVYPTIISLSNANIDNVKEIIKSCSFFNNKADNLIKMAKKVVTDFNGEIPLDEKKLITLAGVGQKTAHVVLIEYTNANLMAVDTHVFRVSHRLGLSYAKTVKKTEEELVKTLRDDLHIFHQAMVLFGRYICTAKNPKCDLQCFLKDICKTKKSFKTG